MDSLILILIYLLKKFNILKGLKYAKKTKKNYTFSTYR